MLALGGGLDYFLTTVFNYPTLAEGYKVAALDAGTNVKGWQRTGGQFTQINPDEPIAWRAFELAAGLNMPQLQNLQISGQWPVGSGQ